MFITGVLGFSNLFQVGQFSGINNFVPQFKPPPLGGFGGIHNTFGGNPLNGGYYKSSPADQLDSYHEFATTEKDLPYADQFYNFEKKKILQNKSDKSFDKEPKVPIEEAAASNTYRNFVWQSS